MVSKFIVCEVCKLEVKFCKCETMTNPILTKREVDAERATLKEAEKTRYDLYGKMFIEGQTRRLEFIEQAVELLRLECTCLVSQLIRQTCDNCKRKQAFLARYDGKEGE